MAQFDGEESEAASDLPWDTDCPDNQTLNSRDCVALVSNSVPDRTSYSAYFRDIQCTETHHDFKIAPICQRGGLEGPTTTTMAQLPTTGVVQSPNYPSDYPSSYNEEKVVVVPEGKLIDVEFDSNFGMETCNSNCGCDYVMVTDGDGTILLPKTCGATKPPTFTSRTNKISVLFHSDGSNNYQGFKLSWKSV